MDIGSLINRRGYARFCVVFEFTGCYIMSSGVAMFVDYSPKTGILPHDIGMESWLLGFYHYCVA